MVLIKPMPRLQDGLEVELRPVPQRELPRLRPSQAAPPLRRPHRHVDAAADLCGTPALLHRLLVAVVEAQVIASQPARSAPIWYAS